MKKNDIIEIEITALSSECSGIGKKDGMVIFVPFSAIGDKLKVRVLKVNKTYAYAKIEEILTPSPDRITPDCPVYGKCGGCSLRHISYGAELAAKQKFVEDAFTRIGGLSPQFLPIIANDEIYGYRNKLQMPIGTDNDGNLTAGFYAFHSHRIIPCKKCLLQPDIFSDIVNEFLKSAQELNISAYDEIARKGILRHIYLRKGHYSGETALCIVAAKYIPALKELSEKLCGKFPQIKTSVININSEDTNVILGDKEIVLQGDGIISDTMCGNKINIAPKAFYQVNTPSAEKLYAAAREFADAKSKTVLDLYCGAGTIGLSMAKEAKKVIGVEIIPEAIENAKHNAQMNKIDNAEFICADAAEASKILLERNLRPDVIIVDPPRKGCGKQAAEQIAAFCAPRIVMVSCNAATAARDCAYFKQLGYETEKCVAVDMFSRTGHVECVVCLNREDKSPFEMLDKTSMPLLYRAAQYSVYGQRNEVESASITDAMFVYLDGSPSPKSIDNLDRNYRLRPLICLTRAWEQFIKKTFPNAHVYKRYMMKPAYQFLTDGEIVLPEGFQGALFDEKAFALHPFSHGENYPSFAEYQEHGAGAVVWHNDKIVASASSFITVNNEIELDVSTEEAYRGKGLASACISLMLQDCAKRGIIVHWDAQNETSLHLAEKFGFEQECAYSVYFLPKRITDETVVLLSQRKSDDYVEVELEPVFPEKERIDK